MPLRIIRNDITKVAADAIVNTANPRPGYGSGTDSAIYKAAGEEQLLEARRRIGSIEPGQAAYTPAFGLPARYIIHTVGPEWQGGSAGELAILESCYRESLLLANALGCMSIAFPLIATGNYGFPRDKALETALKAISDFLRLSEMEVTLVVFDKSAFDLSSDLVEDVRQFIDDRYVEKARYAEYPGGRYEQRRRSYEGNLLRKNALPEAEPIEAAVEEAAASAFEDVDMSYDLSERYFSESFADFEMAEPRMAPQPDSAPARSRGSKKTAAPSAEPRSAVGTAGNAMPSRYSDFDIVIRSLGKTFQEQLFTLIDEKGYSDTEVYKRANIDRKLFSKIRSNPDYKPSKATALALSIALRLNLDQTTDLLRRAGLALSPSSMGDLVVEYCILHSIYSIHDVNALLFKYDQQLLGC